MYQPKMEGTTSIPNPKKPVLKFKWESGKTHHHPRYSTPGSAGIDLISNGTVVLNPGERKLISTIWRFSIPEGYEMQIRPRSGLALKHGITVLNAPGTIDSDYRGPIGVILVNTGNGPYVVNQYDRIAQGIVAKVEHVEFIEVEEFGQTERGEGGFGSTGK